MTALESMAMDDDAPRIGGQIGRILLIVMASLCAIFSAGVIVGIVMGTIERGDGLGLRAIGLLAAAALFVTLALWGVLRTARSFNRAAGTPTSRERRGRIMIVLYIALGMGIGLVLAIAGPMPEGIFSNAPLPVGIALPLAFFIAVPLPVLCYYWHTRIADEQEANAYRIGALLALYAFWIAAPVWWLLWRGGLAPAPDGMILYMLTIVVAGVAWLIIKYR